MSQENTETKEGIENKTIQMNFKQAEFMEIVQELDEKTSITDVIEGCSPFLIRKMKQSRVLNHSSIITDGKTNFKLSLAVMA